MGSRDEVVEEDIDSLERGLLTGTRSSAGSRQATAAEAEEEEEGVLYAASFEEMEERFIKYQTAQWVMYSLLLILAWGIELLMLLYLPVRRYILRKDIRSRQLYLTPNSIVYKVTRPVALPFFWVLKKEKHILLPSVADVVIEQGYLQSRFGLYSLRIEHVGVRRQVSDDVQIQGIANPSAFRKAVLQRLSDMRSESVAKQVSFMEHPSSLNWTSPSKYVRHDLVSGDLVLLQKLEEVGSYVKRVETLIEERCSQIRLIGRSARLSTSCFLLGMYHSFIASLVQKPGTFIWGNLLRHVGALNLALLFGRTYNRMAGQSAEV